MDTHFYSYSEMVSLLKTELSDEYNEDLLQVIIRKGLIVPFYKDDIEYFFDADLHLCKELIKENSNLSEDVCDFFGFHGEIFFDFLKIGKGTFIKDLRGQNGKVPSYVKNIFFFFHDKYEHLEEEVTFNLADCAVVSNNAYVINYLSKVSERKKILDNSKQSDFANTSTYMGIKKLISDFIIEAVWPHCGEDKIFFDLMCGSGSMSHAFSRVGRVYASDAQQFCQLLAKVQGKGFNIQCASDLLNKLYPHYIKNMEALNALCGENVKREDEIFHMDTCNNKRVFSAYMKSVDDMELYSSTDITSKRVKELIEPRKINHQVFPYCLFSFYFSNIYFGVEQCLQIDSIRYAIDNICNQEYRDWLIGVLIITVSVVASNYGGHFAQPKKIEEAKISKILEERKKSVWLEFSKRLTAIAKESERSVHEIFTVSGPWENAIQWLEEQKMEQVLIYLDAPYKREDYSRYYHLLETLAKYDYPTSEYKGRVRSIKTGERFRSEFASRNTGLVEEHFVSIITRILKQKCICAWSYSNNGNADMMRIIDMVKDQIDCNVFVYGISHKHVTQGKREYRIGMKNIIEYCIVFRI